MKHGLTGLLAGLLAGAALTALPALAQESVKIGWAISKTGPNAGGATISLIPNYEMWVKEINAAGGLKLGDKDVYAATVGGMKITEPGIDLALVLAAEKGRLFKAHHLPPPAAKA